MGLNEVILEIADSMEKEELELCNACKKEVARWMKTTSKQLRIAVKAASSVSPSLPMLTKGVVLSDSRQLRDQAATSRAIERVERGGSRMVPLLGGDEDGSTMFELSGDVPQNAKVPIGNRVFVYKDDSLVYSEEDTKRFCQRRQT